MSLSSPLDLLFMDEDAQTVMGYITRQPHATLDTIARVTGMSPKLLAEVVARLLRESHLVEEKQDGQSLFSASYRLSSPPIRNRPSSLDLFA